MPKDVVIGPVPAALLQQVVDDFESEGAQVRTEEGPKGMFTVYATWPQFTVASLTRSPAGGNEGLRQQTMEAVVNIFETGAVRGRYGQVTLLAGDSGGLTFGRSQTTLNSGNLGKLLKRYVETPGAKFAQALAPIAARAQAKDQSLDQDRHTHNLLRASADDLLMRHVQDAFFDNHYMQPALRECANLGLEMPLSKLVVYDSFVHGSWATIKQRVNEQHGSLQALGEKGWVTQYLATRKAWLAGHSNELLRHTVYRMEALERLCALDQWDLALPLVVRGHEISVASLAALPPDCYDGPEPGTRSVALSSPLSRGLDVRAAQLKLSERGFDLSADGVFGKASSAAIRSFQSAQGLVANGVADTATWQQLLA